MTATSKDSTQIESATTNRKNLALSLGAWRHRLLIGIVVAYVALLILAPLVSLLSGAFAKGISGTLTALHDPDVFSSFRLTLYIALITVVIHALFGTALAWV